jgi:hypothetical protein
MYQYSNFIALKGRDALERYARRAVLDISLEDGSTVDVLQLQTHMPRADRL